jgi:hypothetical protein
VYDRQCAAWHSSSFSCCTAFFSCRRFYCEYVFFVQHSTLTIRLWDISRWSLSQYCNNNRSALSLFVCVYLCTCWSASLICPILYCLNCLCYKERENVPFWWKMHKIKKRAKAACLRELPSCVFIRNSDIVVWLCIQEDRNELEQRKLFFLFHLFCSWVKRAKRNNLMLLSLRAAARISSSI